FPQGQTSVEQFPLSESYTLVEIRCDYTSGRSISLYYEQRGGEAPGWLKCCETYGLVSYDHLDGSLPRQLIFTNPSGHRVSSFVNARVDHDEKIIFLESGDSYYWNEESGGFFEADTTQDLYFFPFYEISASSMDDAIDRNTTVDVMINQRYSLALTQWSKDGQQVPSSMILRDRQTSTIYRSDFDVSSAAFSPDGRFLYLGAVYNENAVLSHLDPDEVKQNLRVLYDMSGMGSYVEMKVIDLSDLSLSQAYPFYGGEVFVDENGKVLFTKHIPEWRTISCEGNNTLPLCDDRVDMYPVFELGDSQIIQTQESIIPTDLQDIDYSKKVRSFYLLGGDEIDLQRQEFLDYFFNDHDE
ncbi:hypothetical protein MK079_05410, partial [Candidatus Gracilibacteria bacterium]|nr:hypothetical protein [Candidatus Gracilibacteria bacterium]